MHLLSNSSPTLFYLKIYFIFLFYNFKTKFLLSIICICFRYFFALFIVGKLWDIQSPSNRWQVIQFISSWKNTVKRAIKSWKLFFKCQSQYFCKFKEIINVYRCQITLCNQLYFDNVMFRHCLIDDDTLRMYWFLTNCQ